jgi:2-polyprenyl-6-methoxyphenol hydroxylase-like FAD-dependent oxidoreductase
MDVLVVGAGPTGLAIAGSLAKAGIKVRIIDQNSGPSTQSKALGVQAGTLEAIEQVYGSAVSGEMVRQGFPASRAWLHVDHQEPITVELGQIPSQYNFILILEQSKTEAILEAELQSYGIFVERNQKLISLSQSPAGITSGIRILEDNTTEMIRTRFVIGCDGAHSAVRQAIGVPFDGGTYNGEFILGDIKANWPWEYGVVRTFISEKGALACFPMRGDQRYRFILIPKTESNLARDPAITLADFQKATTSLAPKPILVSDPVWLTRFRVHHRMTKSFRSGNVFLAGDAAHIHSPAGGQGMNTGIQDAFNLADKIIRVINHKADESILENYESERMPVAKKVLRSTDLVFKFALKRDNVLIKNFRKFVLPKIIGSKTIQARFAEAISEVKIARADIKRREVPKKKT